MSRSWRQCTPEQRAAEVARTRARRAAESPEQRRARLDWQIDYYWRHVDRIRQARREERARKRARVVVKAGGAAAHAVASGARPPETDPRRAWAEVVAVPSVRELLDVGPAGWDRRAWLRWARRVEVLALAGGVRPSDVELAPHVLAVAVGPPR